MKILIIDDSEYKVKKVSNLIDNIKKDKKLNYKVAHSYSSGLKNLLEEKFDLLILDMSMPTFDKTNNESGGRFRIFGGREIVRQLKREKKLLPFIVLTQYNKFDDSNKIKSLEEIEELFSSKFKDYHLKTIYYDTSSTKWRNLLEEEILKL